MYYFAITLIVILFMTLMLQYNHPELEPFDGPQESSEEDVSGGASGYFGWGFKPIPETQPSKHHHWHWRRWHRCPKCPSPPPEPNCYTCDITKNKDIDKYVLKSSIPPCPNMDDYALKSEMCPCVDMSQYVHKSQIPQCNCGSIENNPDYSQWMRKSDCASYSFTPQDDFLSWFRFGKWYENRDGSTQPQDNSKQILQQVGSGEQFKITPTKRGVLPYNAIGEIV